MAYQESKKSNRHKYKEVVEALSEALLTMRTLREVELQQYLKNYELFFPEDGVDFRNAIATYEKSLIRMALDKANGNQTQAAELLNLRLSTFNAKIKRFEIKV